MTSRPTYEESSEAEQRQHMPRPGPSVWNDDMDAAPKDGSRFLAWDAEGGCVCLVNWPVDPEPDEDLEWEVYELETLDWISFGWHLTKWTPLPQPDWTK